MGWNFLFWPVRRQGAGQMKWQRAKKTDLSILVSITDFYDHVVLSVFCHVVSVFLFRRVCLTDIGQLASAAAVH